MPKVFVVVTENVKGFEVLSVEWTKDDAKSFKKEYCQHYPYDMVTIKEMQLKDKKVIDVK